MFHRARNSARKRAKDLGRIAIPSYHGLAFFWLEQIVDSRSRPRALREIDDGKGQTSMFR